MTSYTLTIKVAVKAAETLSVKQVKVIQSHLRDLYDAQGFIAEDLVGTNVGGLRVGKIKVTMEPGA